MKPPIEDIVIVDEVRPRDFDGTKIPVTKDELTFFEEYIPFTLTHEYADTFAHKTNLLMLLFHRAIKLESAFASRLDKNSYLNYEVEKINPLLRPFNMQVYRYNDNVSTLFGLKYVLSDALSELSSDVDVRFMKRFSDYHNRSSDVKDFSLIDARLDSFDSSPYANHPVFIFGSATNIKHNALKNSFSDIDTHLIVPIDSFQEYINILSFVMRQENNFLPLSVNIIPENNVSAYFIADPNTISSSHNSLLKGADVSFPIFSANIVYQKECAGLAQNLLRSKKALLDDDFRFWDSSLQAFNAKGKKSNLMYACMKDSHFTFTSDYEQFVSRDTLPLFDDARNILVNQSIEASRVFTQYVNYIKK